MREFVDLAFADREQRRNIGHSEGRCPLFKRIGEVHGPPEPAGKPRDHITVCTICGACHPVRLPCVRILFVTQPRNAKVYRPLIGRSAGNRSWTGQGRQTVRCMRNRQTPRLAGLSAMWLI